jgi:hypothetical protein
LLTSSLLVVVRPLLAYFITGPTQHIVVAAVFLGAAFLLATNVALYFKTRLDQYQNPP